VFSLAATSGSFWILTHTKVTLICADKLSTWLLITSLHSVVKNPGIKTGFVRALTNGLMFNVSWFAIVYVHSAYWALAIAAAHLLFHFSTVGRSMVEARFILGVSLLGLLLDQILFAAGVFRSPNSVAFAPLWISCLWPVLATTLMHAFSALQQRPILASIAGAIGGGGSYIAGTRLSDVDFSSPLWGPVIMAGIWAVLFPLLLRVARSKMPAEVANDEHS
jgi:hypothetical protein